MCCHEPAQIDRFGGFKCYADFHVPVGLMDLEAPADAWYVWFGVVLVTLAFAGVALSFPSEPAPDATQAANTIDEVAASSFNASATYDHDANEVYVGLRQVGMRNSGGTDTATVAFGTMSPVRESDSPKKGFRVLRGEDPEAVFDQPDNMQEWAKKVRSNIESNDGAQWRQAEGRLRVKHVQWGDVSVIFVDA